MFFFFQELDLTRFRADLGERIQQAIENSGTKSDAAGAAGVTTEQLNKWIKGAVKVPVEALWALSAHADVDFCWLATGVGAMRSDAARTLNKPSSVTTFADKRDGQIAVAAKTEMVQLPVYDIEAAAGYGAAVQGEVKLGEVAFDRQFLRDRGASPETCTVIRAKGDSMSPTIPDGSLLIVDHSQQDIAHGYITVIGIGNDLLVKRIRRRLDGTVELISDNQAYAPEVIGSDRLEHLRVVGRVVYFCRVP